MSVAKSVLKISAWLFAVTAMALLACDAFLLLSSGWDLTDVAGVSNGFAIEWPTGERPSWAMLPAYAYSIGLLLLACALLMVRRRVGRIPLGHTSR